MGVRVWPRRWSFAAGGKQRWDEYRDQDQRSAEQAHEFAVGYGRMMRAVQQQYPDEDLRDGSAYVCGVGSLPVPLLVALADLEDARDQAQAHPDELARENAVYQARKAYLSVARETSARERAGP